MSTLYVGAARSLTSSITGSWVKALTLSLPPDQLYWVEANFFRSSIPSGTVNCTLQESNTVLYSHAFLNDNTKIPVHFGAAVDTTNAPSSVTIVVSCNVNGVAGTDIESDSASLVAIQVGAITDSP